MTRSTVARLPIVCVLVVAALVAIVFGSTDPEPAPAADDVDAPATQAAEGTRTSAWFCPGVPPSVPLEAQSLSLANVGTQPADVVVTVAPDDGSAPVTQAVEIGARSAQILPRAQLGPGGGVIVESFSADVVAEAGVESSNELALGPCASAANDEWFFAGGTTGNFEPNTTGRPVEQWLVLFNPFGTDARVEVTLRTNAAVPDELAPIDVPRRTRVLVPVHDETVRTPQVAVQVHATVGQVVVEQSMIFGADSGYTGITRSHGVVAPEPVWTFADGWATPGSRTVFAIVNPGLVDTEVDVIVSGATTPLTVPVRRDAVVWIQVGGCGDPPAEGCVAVPDDASYTTSIVTDADTPVVAEQLAFFGSAPISEGIAALTGARATPTALFARAGVADGRAVTLAIANPGAVPVTADVRIVRGGTSEEPSGLQGIEVAPGQRVAFDLGPVLGLVDGAVVVEASGPVVAGRSIYTPGDLSRADAIAGRE
jgi:hypothetical protein